MSDSLPTQPTVNMRAEWDARHASLVRYARAVSIRASVPGVDREDLEAEVLLRMWVEAARLREWPTWGYWRIAASRAIYDLATKQRALKRIPHDKLVPLDEIVLHPSGRYYVVRMEVRRCAPHHA